MDAQKIRVKWVKKANMWCKTYFIADKTGKLTQKQEWSSEKPVLDKKS